MSGAKTAAKGGVTQQRRHFCVEHDLACSVVMHMPGRKMRWRCTKGCSLTTLQTVFK